MSRALTRHHLKRMKTKARKIFYMYSDSWSDTSEDNAKLYEKWANHLKMCSCYGCSPNKYKRKRFNFNEDTSKY